MFKYRNTVFYDHILETRIVDHIFPENTVLKIFISHPSVNSSPPAPLPHRFKPVLRVGFYFQSFVKQKNVKIFIEINYIVIINTLVEMIFHNTVLITPCVCNTSFI